MRSFWLLLAAVAAGCGSPPDPNAPVAADAEEIARGATRAFGVTTAFITSGLIQITVPPDSVAQAVLIRSQSETNACAMASATGPSVSAAFTGNGTDGCTLATVGLKVLGTVDIAITGAMGNAVTLVFTEHITVDGKNLDAVMEAFTVDGNMFTYQLDSISWAGGASGVLKVFKPGFDSRLATVDGTGQLTGRSGSSLPVIYTDVETGFTDCYPQTGTAVVSLPTGDVKVNFTETGATDGSVIIGDATTSTITSQLPARTGCPRPEPQ